MKKPNIRTTTINDLESILNLNRQLFEFEQQFTNTYNPDWTYSDKGRDYFKKRLGQDNAICLVAETNQEIIGYLVSFIDTYSYRSTNPICELENMYILPQYRRQGIGTKLVDELKKIAKKKGANRLRVETITQNQVAGSFYQAMGCQDFNLILEQEL